MKKSTASKLKMYESVHTVFNEYASSWQQIPAFENAVNNFNNTLELLRSRIEEQAKTTQGVTLKRKLRLEDLYSRMLPVQHALYLLGRSIQETGLQVRNEVSASELRKWSMGEFASRCTQLIGDIDSFGADLGAYGITQQTLDELVSMLQGIDELSNSTRQAIIKRKGITQEILKIEQDLNKLLRVELDRMMELFKESDPEFYRDFQNARIVIDYGRHAPKGENPEGSAA